MRVYSRILLSVLLCVLAACGSVAWNLPVCTMPRNWVAPSPLSDAKCTVAIDLYLVLDFSLSIFDESLHLPGSWQHMLTFAQHLVGVFKHQATSIGIITFNGNAHEELAPTTDRGVVMKTLHCMKSKRPVVYGTNIGKALKIANDHFYPPHSEHAAVYLVISDGREEFFYPNKVNCKDSMFQDAQYCSSTLRSQREIALSKGVHISTVQVGDLDQKAHEELLGLATTHDFFTHISDFYSMNNKDFEQRIIHKVCLLVHAVIPSAISQEQARQTGMLVELEGSAFSVAKKNNVWCVFIATSDQTNVRRSVRPVEYVSSTDRLRCYLPSSPNYLTLGSYRIELQFASGMRTSGTTVLKVEGSPCVCYNGGTYVNGMCVCVPGWTGEYCQEQINECASTPCQNGGTCKDLVNGYQCTCPSGSYGTHCDKQVDTCTKPCQNGGTCVNGACVCTALWIGEYCEKLRYDDCASQPCQNGGTCYNYVHWFAMTNAAGSLQSSSVYCVGVSTENCIPLRGYHCSCPEDFYGTNCQNRRTPCDSYPCQNGGTCVAGMNSFVCECETPFYGSVCQQNSKDDKILGLTIANLCVLSAVAFVVIVLLTWAVCVLRRIEENGRPKWKRYCDSFNNYMTSFRESFRHRRGDTSRCSPPRYESRHHSHDVPRHSHHYPPHDPCSPHSHHDHHHAPQCHRSNSPPFGDSQDFTFPSRGFDAAPRFSNKPPTHTKHASIDYSSAARHDGHCKRASDVCNAVGNYKDRETDWRAPPKPSIRTPDPMIQMHPVITSHASSSQLRELPCMDDAERSLDFHLMIPDDQPGLSSHHGTTARNSPLSSINNHKYKAPKCCPNVNGNCSRSISPAPIRRTRD
jgi:hypothetical protein